MKFSGLTQKGRGYLAKVQANGQPIQFTKIKIGNAKLTEHENPANLTDIKNIKAEKSILEKTIEEDATVLTTVIENVGVQEGYFPREIGIYVQDGSSETLYYYINDGDETSWLPPYSDGPHRMELKINLISSSTGSIIVNDNGSQVFVTRKFVEDNYTQKGTFSGTAGDLENRITGLAGKQNGKFPLNSAIKGNVYLLEQTQKFYVCTQNYSGTTISVPNANFTELSVYENMNRLENLMTFKKQVHSKKGYFTAEIYSLSNLILIEIISAGKELLYLENDECQLDFRVRDVSSSITGNNGTAGQIVVRDNKVIVQATDKLKGLSHSFYAQIITMLTS